jgi:hypothetical protein
MRTVPTLLAALLLLASAAWAQAPSTMPVQLKLTDSQGAAVTGNVTVSFSIYATEGVGTGTALWGPENHTVTTPDGVISILLGDGSPAVPLSSTVFDGSVRYLSVRVGGGSEMDPRLPIGSSAYAYSADRVTSYVTRLLYAGTTTLASTGEFQLMLTMGTFVKQRADTVLRVSWLSHTHGSGTGFCQYQLRIDGIKDDGTSNVNATYGNTGEAVVYAGDQAVNVMTYFDGIGRGSRDAQIWLRGNGIDCSINWGNFQNQVIIEEILPGGLVVNKTVVEAKDESGLQMGIQAGRF